MAFRISSALGFVLLFFAAGSAASIKELFKNPRLDDGRIIGGRPLAAPEPYMVSIRNSNGNHICGGTLITKDIVLTAAHCLEGLNYNPIVHIGRLRRQDPDTVLYERMVTAKKIMHPSYNEGYSWNYDVALLVLKFDSSKEVLPLAKSDACFETYEGCEVRLLGWGRTVQVDSSSASNVLREAFTSSISRSKCAQDYAFTYQISNNMICAGESNGGIDACKGDSGGPMILKGEQVGIVSFGEGCGQPGKPGVYASVPKLLPWIQNQIQQIQDDCECTTDGISGGVATGRIGCGRHFTSLSVGYIMCMVKGGTSCPIATEDPYLTGAAWKYCSYKGDPCECSPDGYSGYTYPGRVGCAQHLRQQGIDTQFCMVYGGSDCKSAFKSKAFPGAYWKLC